MRAASSCSYWEKTRRVFAQHRIDILVPVKGDQRQAAGSHPQGAAEAHGDEHGADGVFPLHHVHADGVVARTDQEKNRVLGGLGDGLQRLAEAGANGVLMGLIAQAVQLQPKVVELTYRVVGDQPFAGQALQHPAGGGHVQAHFPGQLGQPRPALVVLSHRPEQSDGSGNALHHRGVAFFF